MRSLVLRSNSLKGRKSIIPVEFYMHQIEKCKTLDLKKCMEILFEPMKHKINQTWTCLDCPTDESFFLPFDFPHVQGKDVFQILSAWVKEGCQEGHEKKPFLNPDAECFFFSCEFGVTANLEQILQFQEKLWKIKSVIGKNHQVFYSNRSYYTIEGKEVQKYEKNCVLDSVIIVFELSNDEVNNDENLSYKGNELIKIRDTFLRKGDRHKNPNKDRHTTPRTGDRHKNPNEDRHKNPNKDRHKKDLKSDTGIFFLLTFLFLYSCLLHC